MAMFPEVQAKAQAELDRHVGCTRLRNFQDLKSLTYIKAVLMETLRWIPTLPLGIPHSLMEDDEYRGYHIPKNTMVVAKFWMMLHNPEDYPSPETVNPERLTAASIRWFEIQLRSPLALDDGPVRDWILQ